MARPKRTVTAVDKAAEIKEEVKEVAKEAPKAAALAPKTAPKAAAEIEKTVVIEFGGKQIKARDVLAQAEEAYAQSHPGTAVKTMELYISPEQSAAYYVVNGEASEDFKIGL